ncbi:MAG: hypothetical protein KatS3mg050_4809 [Litorilinea sp.]|nr:MAG: hypothetical protein KatS3mg050_4676 [Litorilinea sp.]GIV80415.1 MAG: hypothetical protein KatS3mg050_4809 [Litorilinea sp.]
MSEFRQDPTTREWVLLAPERAKRPEDFPQHQRPMAPAWDPDCPFCPGNEQRTPEEETFRIGTHGSWQVRVVTKLQPFAPQAPYETWILPNRHVAAFGDVADEELSDLAVVLRDTLRALTAQLQGLDFNYVIQTAPVGEAHLNYYLWHVQIVPRLTTPAGFELGSGISISTALPEETARLLRAQVRQRRLETED